jgi:hypothetical protein
MANEIHVLNDEWMERRAGGEDSLRALKGTAERMYCQLVLAANNSRLPPMWTPRRFLTYLRWAWLIEGGAQYFTAQTSLFRAAVITRLREGDKPAFPPRRRDAIILGGTIFDLLDRTAGPQACQMLVSRLRREGPEGNLELVFEAPIREIERAWRRHLDEILYRVEPGEASLSDEMRKAGLTPPEGEPRLRRRRPRDEETLGDLDIGTLPEFGFEARGEGSAGELVEDPDERPRREQRRSDPGR